MLDTGIQLNRMDRAEIYAFGDVKGTTAFNLTSYSPSASIVDVYTHSNLS